VKNHLRLLRALCLACILATILGGRRAAAVVGAVLFAILLPGLAAAADPASTSVDVGPLLANYVLPFVGSLVALLGVWALRQIEVRLGLDKNARLSGMLETAMTNGLAFAQSQLAGKIGNGPLMVDVKNEAVAIAARYAADHVPDAIKTLGVTPDLLAQKIEARLTLNTTPSAASIAVPTPDVAHAA
jgi:hypothetical protein